MKFFAFVLAATVALSWVAAAPIDLRLPAVRPFDRAAPSDVLPAFDGAAPSNVVLPVLALVDRAALPEVAGTSLSSIPEEADCDRICRQRILYYTTYASATTGITMVMEAHDAWDWCSSDPFCPALMNSTSAAIAMQLVAQSPVVKDCGAACLLEELAVTSQHAAYLSSTWALTQVSGLNRSGERVERMGMVVDELAVPPQRPLFDHRELGKVMAADTHDPTDDDGEDSGDATPLSSAGDVGRDLAEMSPIAAAAPLLLGPFVGQSPCSPLARRSPADGICDPKNLKYPGRIWDKLLQGKAGRFLRKLFRGSTSQKMGSSRSLWKRLQRYAAEGREQIPYVDEDATQVSWDDIPARPAAPKMWPDLDSIETLHPQANIPKGQFYSVEDFDAASGRMFRRVLEPAVDPATARQVLQLLDQGYQAYQEVDRDGMPIELESDPDGPLGGAKRYQYHKESEMKKFDWRDMLKNSEAAEAAAAAAAKAEAAAEAEAAAAPVVEAEAEAAEAEAASEAASPVLLDSLAQPIVPLGPAEFAAAIPKPRVNPNGPVEYVLFGDDPATAVGEYVYSVSPEGEIDPELCMSGGLGRRSSSCNVDPTENSAGGSDRQHESEPSSDAEGGDAAPVERPHNTHKERPHPTHDDSPRTTVVEPTRTVAEEEAHTSPKKHGKHPHTAAEDEEDEEGHTSTTKHGKHPHTATDDDDDDEEEAHTSKKHHTKSKKKHPHTKGKGKKHPHTTSTSTTTSHHGHTPTSEAVRYFSSDPEDAAEPLITAAPAPLHLRTTAFETCTKHKKHKKHCFDVTQTLALSTYASESVEYSTNKKKQRIVAVSTVMVAATTWVEVVGPAATHFAITTKHH